MRKLKKLFLNTSGNELVEMAVMMPVLFSVLLAIFYFGRAYNIYGTITQAAIQGARAAVVTQCATCGNAALPADQIATNIVGPALRASHLDPAAVTYTQPNLCPCGSAGACTAVTCDALGTGASPSICVQQNVRLTNTVGTAQACGTAVSFNYPYNFNLPFQMFTLNLKAAAQMQSENQQ